LPPKEFPRQLSLRTSGPCDFGLIPDGHPAEKGWSLEKLNDEAAAYIAAMGWDAFERQWTDGIAEERAAAIAKKARAVASAIKAERKERARRKRDRAAREHQVARLPARQQRKRGAAVALMLELLAHGESVRASRVIEAVTAAGVSRRTLKTAKRELGVESQRRGWGPGSYVLWSLPKSQS
jgi:hypothetical protein